ncbi:MAG TPA: hypothetical protein DCQ92_12760 [Verrucomicrobia subdivision 3 bacterium]|nr:hypothetical protein [Limisphaerales bacterium]
MVFYFSCKLLWSRRLEIRRDARPGGGAVFENGGGRCPSEERLVMPEERSVPTEERVFKVEEPMPKPEREPAHFEEPRSRREEPQIEPEARLT